METEEIVGICVFLIEQDLIVDCLSETGIHEILKLSELEETDPLLLTLRIILQSVRESRAEDRLRSWIGRHRKEPVLEEPATEKGFSPELRAYLKTLGEDVRRNMMETIKTRLRDSLDSLSLELALDTLFETDG